LLLFIKISDNINQENIGKVKQVFPASLYFKGAFDGF